MRSDEEITRLVQAEARRMIDAIKDARRAGRRQGEGYELNVPRLPFTASEVQRMGELLEEAVLDD